MNPDSLMVQSLSLSYQTSTESVSVIKNISLQLKKGETIALIGESGSGKTSLAKAMAGLIPSPKGSIFLTSSNTILTPDSRSYKKKIQLLFQNPDAVFNPKKTIQWHFDEVLSLWHPTSTKKEREKKILSYGESLELDPSVLSRFAFELSGGQKQRASLLRSLLVEPDFLLLDEPLASQDATKKKCLLNLLKKLQSIHSLGYLYITHDLSSLGVFSDTIAVLYQGSLVEWSQRETLLANPVHPYTKKLLQARLLPINDELRLREKTIQ